MSRFLVAAASVVAAAPLAAQTAPAAPSAAVTRAAATITEADIRRRIGIIADDSMLGRDTPSRGLDLTAQYVADEFKRLGLRPGGDAGGYLQRYGVTRKALDRGASNVTLVVAGREIRATFEADALWQRGGVPAQPISAPAVLVGPGGVTDSALVTDKVALVAGDVARGAQGMQALRGIAAGRPVAIVIVSNREAAAFTQALALNARPRLALDGAASGRAVPWVEIPERALGGALAAEIAAARAEKGPFTRTLEGVTAGVTAMETVLEHLAAPNTIGILEGTDPVLKGEYVAFSGHMDHIGIRPGAADSINNGADDDASGTAAVLELAEAFAQKGARPKRSLVFIGVSGEEKGLWGSQHWAEHPTVPIDKVVADLNIDMLGRNWKDTMAVIGREHSDLGQLLDAVNAAHPELGVRPAGDLWPQERIYFRSDHYNFARKGVPILFFTSGLHADYHQPSDSPEKIDAEKEARMVRLIFYTGWEVATRGPRPQWNPESYRQIVQGPGR